MFDSTFFDNAILDQGIFMADITNTQAIKFCNERLRVIADQYAQLYYVCKATSAAWSAQNMGTLIPNTVDVVLDGSAADGRAPITGAKVNALMTNINLLTSDLEATSNTKLNVLLQIAVNPVR